MRRVCSWCNKELGPKRQHAPDAPVTHGICSPCALKLAAESPRSAQNMLNLLEEPVFLVDGDGVMHAANRSGCRLLGKELDAITDHLGGDVFECANAKLAGGCGQTVHCSLCTIRNTLITTLETGKAVSQVPATRNINTPTGERDIHFLISTEKVDGRVLLKIDEVDDREAWGS